MDERAELIRVFKIAPRDLDANREGRLGDTQRRRVTRDTVVGVFVGVLWTALGVASFAAGLGTPGVPAVDWIIPGTVALFGAAFTVAVARSHKREMASPVTCITGTVSCTEVSRARIVRVNVAGHAFRLLPRPWLRQRATMYQRILTGQPYHVYVWLGSCISMEPASAAAPNVTSRVEEPEDLSTEDVFFCSIGVSNLRTSLAWYVGVMGRPADISEWGEVRWWISDHWQFYLVESPEYAGHDLVTIAVADLDETVTDLEARGLHCEPIGLVAGGARGAVIADPDGNKITFVEAGASVELWVRYDPS